MKVEGKNTKNTHKAFEPHFSLLFLCQHRWTNQYCVYLNLQITPNLGLVLSFAVTEIFISTYWNQLSEDGETFS